MGGDTFTERKLGGFSSCSSSSSSNFGSGALYSLCDCGLKPVLLTSRTKQNPGRKFMRCPKYKSKFERCDYFEWVDCENCEKKEIRVRRLLGLLTGTWVLLVVVVAVMWG